MPSRDQKISFATLTQAALLGSWCLGILLFGLVPHVYAQTSWTGQRVFVKRPNTPFRDVTKNTVVGKLNQISFQVLAEKDGWLLVVNRGKEGWVEKSNLLLTKDAIVHYTNELKRYPKSTTIYRYRAVAWRHSKRMDKALADYDAALRLKPTQASIWNDRGIVWSVQKKYDKAIADYSKAITLRPTNSVAFFNRGLAWLNKRNLDKALADFSRGLEINPQDVNGHRYRGIVWRRLGKHDKAIADFDRALELYPKAAYAYIGRGMTWEAKRDFAKARQDFEQAVRLQPKLPSAMYTLARLLATCPDTKHRDGKRAVTLAKTLCKLTKNRNPQYLAARAAAHAAAGQFQDAVWWQERVMQDESYLRSQRAEMVHRLRLYKSQKPYQGR